MSLVVGPDSTEPGTFRRIILAQCIIGSADVTKFFLLGFLTSAVCSYEILPKTTNCDMDSIVSHLSVGSNNTEKQTRDFI